MVKDYLEITSLVHNDQPIILPLLLPNLTCLLKPQQLKFNGNIWKVFADKVSIDEKPQIQTIYLLNPCFYG